MRLFDNKTRSKYWTVEIWRLLQLTASKTSLAYCKILKDTNENLKFFHNFLDD